MLKRELVNEVAEQLGDYYKQDVAQAVDIKGFGRGSTG